MQYIFIEVSAHETLVFGLMEPSVYRGSPHDAIGTWV